MFKLYQSDMKKKIKFKSINQWIKLPIVNILLLEQKDLAK